VKLPCGVAGTPEIMNWISRDLGAETCVNLMAQYHPPAAIAGTEYAEINRSTSPSEFERAVGAFLSAGLSRLDREPRFANCSERVLRGVFQSSPIYEQMDHCTR
jgi:putative pyruvate formate lyase activating enzyme